jgi:hypothetical protein
MLECFEDFWRSSSGDSLDNSYWTYIHRDRIERIDGSFNSNISNNIKLWIDAHTFNCWVWVDTNKSQLNIWLNDKCTRDEAIKEIKPILRNLYVPRFKNKSESEEEKKSMLDEFYNKLALKYATLSILDYHKRGDI